MPQSLEQFSTGALLGGVRRSLGFSVEQMAARLGIPIALVVELERDPRFASLPMSDVAAVIRAWMALAGLDAGMVLSSLGRPGPTGVHYSPHSPPVEPLLPAGLVVPRRQPPPVSGQPTGAPAGNTRTVQGDKLATIARSLGGSGSGSRGSPGGLSRTDDDERDHDEFLDPQRLRDRFVLAGYRVRHTLSRLRAAVSPSAYVQRLADSLTARLAGRLAAVALAMAALGGTFGYTSVGATAVSSLPAPASRAVRSLSDFWAEHFAPVRDGHRWIEVSDPRSRRADKLPIARQSD